MPKLFLSHLGNNFGTSNIYLIVYKLISNLDKIDETIKSQVDTVNENISQILLKIYPIGSIYISVSDTNPNEFFGGTWERIAQGRTLISEGTSDQTFKAGTQGGESKHKLTFTEMPTHTHSGFVQTTNGTGGSKSTLYSNVFYKNSGVPSGEGPMVTINASGGGVSHNNLPPYLVVYMWKRTA